MSRELAMASRQKGAAPSTSQLLTAASKRCSVAIGSSSELRRKQPVSSRVAPDDAAQPAGGHEAPGSSADAVGPEPRFRGAKWRGSASIRRESMPSVSDGGKSEPSRRGRDRATASCLASRTRVTAGGVEVGDGGDGLGPRCAAAAAQGCKAAAKHGSARRPSCLMRRSSRAAWVSPEGTTKSSRMDVGWPSPAAPAPRMGSGTRGASSKTHGLLKLTRAAAASPWRSSAQPRTRGR
jgi:hypothetical protein